MFQYRLFFWQFSETFFKKSLIFRTRHLVGYFFCKKSLFNQNTRKKSLRTLPNSVIDLFMRVLWNSCNKTLENIEKNIHSGALFVKSTLQIHFWKWSRRKRCSKRTLCIAAPFSLILKVCSPEIPTSTKTGSKKNVSWERSEILQKLPWKRSIMKLFY